MEGGKDVASRERVSVSLCLSVCLSVSLSVLAYSQVGLLYAALFSFVWLMQFSYIVYTTVDLCLPCCRGASIARWGLIVPMQYICIYVCSVCVYVIMWYVLRIYLCFYLWQICTYVVARKADVLRFTSRGRTLLVVHVRGAVN